MVGYTQAASFPNRRMYRQLFPGHDDRGARRGWKSDKRLKASRNPQGNSVDMRAMAGPDETASEICGGLDAEPATAAMMGASGFGRARDDVITSRRLTASVGEMRIVCCSHQKSQPCGVVGKPTAERPRIVKLMCAQIGATVDAQTC